MTRTAIVMAIYHPNPDFLDQQFASLARQTDLDFTVYLVIADGASLELCETLLRGQVLRAVYLTPSTRLNAAQAFEFGLSHGVDQAHEYIALSDQDDIWHPERLQKGISALQDTGADLAHSDARIINENGALVSRSLFDHENRVKGADTQDLLYRNTVTGMTTVMRASFAKSTLPFPRQDGTHFYHDLWLALAASAQNGLAFVPHALVDYRQHGTNAVGAAQRSVDIGPKARIAAYALSRYLAQEVAIRWPKTKKIHAFVGAKSLGLSHLRKALEMAVSGHRQQMQIALWAFACVWLRRLWAGYQSATDGYQRGLAQFDEKAFNLSPGVAPQATAAPSTPLPRQSWWTLRDGRMVARIKTTLDPDPMSHGRFVVLVPSLNPSEAFAGIATALDMGLGLLERGHQVVFVATDLPIAQRDATQSFLRSRLNGPWPHDRCTLCCGVTEDILPLTTSDRIIATAWWTAHIADTWIARHGLENQFLYLIQDFEPGFYPWGTEHASALATYSLPHVPIYNSAPLRDYFADQKIGNTSPHAMCFHPAVSQDNYLIPPRLIGTKRRLAIYGRPDVARNLFPLCIDALGTWLERNCLTEDDLEIVSLGQKHADIELPGDITLRSLGKLPWTEYPEYLATVDMGLSLMCSPHPSHPPLEMAVAGIPTVTNAFGTKDLRHMSPNIISTNLSAADVADALSCAWLMPRRAPSPIDLTQLGSAFDTVLDRIATDQMRHSLAA